MPCCQLALIQSTYACPPMTRPRHLTRPMLVALVPDQHVKSSKVACMRAWSLLAGAASLMLAWNSTNAHKDRYQTCYNATSIMQVCSAWCECASAFKQSGDSERQLSQKKDSLQQGFVQAQDVPEAKLKAPWALSDVVANKHVTCICSDSHVNQHCLLSSHQKSGPLGAELTLQPLGCSLEAIGSPSCLLQVWAPALLRRLYERDGRRAFCPPALWLAPFRSQFSSCAKVSDQGSSEVVLAAVNYCVYVEHSTCCVICSSAALRHIMLARKHE